MQLNTSKYCYVSVTIQLNIGLHTVEWQTVLFQAIQFSISPLWALDFNYQTVLFDPQIETDQVLPILVKVNLGVKTMNGYSAFPKLQYY